jgi:hypothetical protein
MLVNTKAKSNQFAPARKGLHDATCVAVVQLGSHTNSFRNEEEEQLLFTFQLAQAQANGEPYLLNHRVRFLFCDGGSALDKVVEALLGEVPENLDLRSLVGKPCRLRVEHETSKGKGRLYGKVAWDGFQSAYPRMNAPKPIRTFSWFFCDGFPFPAEQAAWLPSMFGEKSVAAYIAEAEEMTRPQAPPLPPGPVSFGSGSNEDVPF